MLTYVAIYIFFAFCCFIGRDWRTERAYIILAMVFLALFVGTRLDTGCDFKAYFLRFSGLDISESFFDIVRREEPGFWVIAYWVKSLSLDYVWVNVIGAIIFFFCAGKFLLRHPNPALLLAIMFPIMIVQLSMSGLRQALAVAFLMLALLSFFDEKKIGIVLYILFGSIFHQSLILFLPLALIVGREFSTSRIIAAVALIMPVALIISSDRLDVYSDRYVEQIYGEMESSGALFRLGLLVLSALAFEIYKDKIKVLFPKQYSLMRLFSLISFALIPVSFLSTVVMHRLGFYVLPVQLYTLALLPFVIFKDFKAINFGQVFPLGIYASYLIVWFAISSHARICYVPYQTFVF